ncbi:hypothetical protein Vretimale_4926 [Volvox reticuliferus]|uniref:tRNA threonylcarbamoyladenosine biosynthesis protein TsaE n=1 Tax=Volvox reticuliferus TaxID=1737510 RepID=A0A8J4FJ11_9CHLO|nr:hypothetical protein Vretifemale_4174 [Volvox reticuliferus]GIL99881.1 hypothetical protein Vretimale_4926 [Volvox reticuliferus]
MGSLQHGAKPCNSSYQQFMNYRLPRHIRKPLSARPHESRPARSHTISAESALATLPTQHRLAAPTVQAMDCLAALFASHIRAGDCYCLFGAVGAGKSVFSRAFIRAVAEDDFLPVPSPTFLLQNTYDEHQGPPIHHFDFYRLSSVQDFNRLDLEGSLAHAVCLMEWPERLPSLPAHCLAVQIEIVDEPPAALQALGLPLTTTSAANGSAKPASGRPHGSYDDNGGFSHSVSGTTHMNIPEDVDTEAEGDEFIDRRLRLVTLTPYGSYWESRARRIISYIAAHSHACDGLVVLQESETSATTGAPGGSSSLS